MKGNLYLKSVILLLVTAATVNAGFTKLGLSTENTTLNIMQHLYGDNMEGAVWGGQVYQDQTTGITATRIDDIFDYGNGSSMNLISGTPGGSLSDQYWNDGIAVTSVSACFAGYSQTFGYVMEGVYRELFKVKGSGFAVSGAQQDVVFDPPAQWQWVRGGDGQTFYSANQSNTDGMDHMITYQITGLDNVYTTWLLMWEDLPGDALRSDRDFNDLVVQIQAKSRINTVPAPAALGLGLVGLMGIGVLRKNKTI
ncbi:MAG: DUF4114 domain-containing protein [Sedimentisphaerales bacterium]|nr:DUF4114 domain-containing protein [Sedimentisphaerales bacterium]